MKEMVHLNTSMLLLVEENDAFATLTYESKTSSIQSDTYFKENYYDSGAEESYDLMEADYIDLQTPLVILDSAYEEWNLTHSE